MSQDKDFSIETIQKQISPTIEENIELLKTYYKNIKEIGLTSPQKISAIYKLRTKYEMTFQEIGDLFGMTRQGAHDLFNKYESSNK